MPWAQSTHLNVIPYKDLVVHHKLVVLQHAVHAGIGSLDGPHEPPQLVPAFPRLPVHVLRYMDVAPPQ